MPEEKKLQQIVITELDEGTMVDVKWKFKNPYAFGGVLGGVVYAVMKNFIDQNPDKPALATLPLILEGMMETLADRVHSPEDTILHRPGKTN